MHRRTFLGILAASGTVSATERGSALRDDPAVQPSSEHGTITITSVPGGVVSPGDSVSFDVEVRNTADEDDTLHVWVGVGHSDSDGQVEESRRDLSVGAGDTVTETIDVTLPSTAPPGVYGVQANVRGIDASDWADLDSQSGAFSVEASYDAEVTIHQIGADTVQPGDTLPVTVEATNTGDATGEFHVETRVLDEEVIGSVTDEGTLDPGEDVTGPDGGIPIDESAAAGTYDVEARIRLAGTTDWLDSALRPGGVEVIVPVADLLSFSAFADGAAPGGDATVVLNLTNEGDSPITNPSIHLSGIWGSWTRTELDPDGGTWDEAAGTWSIDELGAGETRRPEITFAVPSEASPGSYDLDAEVRLDGDQISSAVASVDVLDPAAQALSLSANGDGGEPGTDVTATFTVENSDEEPLAAPTIEVGGVWADWNRTGLDADGGSWDESAGIWTISELPGGETRSPSVTFTIPSDAGSGDHELPATLRYDGDVVDQSTATVTVESPPAEQMTLTGTDATAGPGEETTLAMTVQNPADAAITDLALELGGIFDQWELVSFGPDGGTWDEASGTWTTDELPAGESRSPTVTLRVPEDAAPGGHELQIVAIVAGASVAQAAASVDVSVAAANRIAFDVTGETTAPGGSVTAFFELTNLDDEPVDAPSIEVSGVPEDWSRAGLLPGGGTWTDTTWSIDSLPAGATESPRIVYAVPEGTAPGTYELLAEVRLDGSVVQTGTVTMIVEGDGLCPYTDAQGRLGTSGLLTAIDHWRAGDIGTSRLLNGIDAWRSGDPVAGCESN